MTPADAEGASVARRLLALRGTKREALQALLDRRAGARPRISRRPQQAVPLSSGQQRLWFLHQWNPRSAAYNIPAIVPLSTRPDVALVQRVLTEIVRRHGSLRTVFRETPDGPVQDVRPDPTPHLRVVDLDGATDQEHRARFVQLATAEAQQAFDLARGPVFRAVLYRAPGPWTLQLTMPHIVSDGWSIGVLTHELDVLLRALGRGEPSPLSELPVQYTDFARWQRETLTSEFLARQLTYWRGQLDGVSTLALPTDRPRPAAPSHQGAQVTVFAPGEARDRLRRFNDREHVTMHMTLLAACQALLHRYSGQDDVVVGSPMAGRNVPEAERLIGFFVNTLVIRTNVGGRPSFRELVQRVRTVALEAFDNQDLPFEQLVSALGPERDLSRNPFFQVTFQLFAGTQSAREAYQPLHGAVEIDKGSAVFDLAFNLWETARGIEGRIEYSTDLFDHDTVSRLAEHFVVLLEAAGRDPDTSVAELPIMSDGERRTVLVEWNDTASGTAAPVLAHDQVAVQAAAAPGHPAVRAGGSVITYGELNARANRIAHTLLAAGLPSDRAVAVSLDPGHERIAALLGVLKSGRPYVPIAPGLPAERVAFLLQDSGAAAFIGGSGPVDLPRGVFGLSPGSPLSDRADDPSVRVSPSDLAYIIYTSGSTGKPKGVAVEHRALANLVDWHRVAYRLSRDDRASHVASFSFDAAVWETWATLAAGATLVIADADTRGDPDRLMAWLAAEQVTVSFLPTPLAEEVLRRPHAATLSLRYLLTGGDRLRTHPPRGLPFQVVNHYGPTENAVVATAGPVKADAEGLPDIGRPIANNQVYLLDPLRQPVPIGVTGEIYIGGRSLARAYHQRPDLTGARFVPHPFSDAPGARLFRTGDLARWKRDGTIAFVGRNDRQVKVRGVRIEPAEIEAALSRDPSVAGVVVVPRDDPRGGTRLVAYITPVPGLPAAAVARQCRPAAAACLPEYMIPSVFVPLDAMPLTAHGKIDVAALPLPTDAATSIPSEAGRTGPAVSVTEAALVAIWKDVLRLESVPLDAGFFSDFGGHSLLAVAVIGRIRERLQVEVPLRAVFEAPTVRLLAALVERAPPLAAATWAIPRRLARDTAPCSFAQRRLWFLDRLTPGGSFYNIPASVRLRTTLDPARLQQSLDVLVARHDVLRTTIRTIDGEPVQHIAPDGVLSITIEDLQRLSSEEREAEAVRRAAVEARRPFDLEGAPLARVTLIRLAPDDAVLLTTVHHIICDGASLDLLFREWTDVYQALDQGETPTLPELRIQFGDYADWQRRWLTGGVIETQRRYWAERLDGLSPLALPTDRPRPALASYTGSHALMQISASATAGLKTLAADEGATLFMTVAAALQTLLARYAGQDDVAIGTIAAGRQQSELQHVMGLFVNTLVLRSNLGGNPTFRELLHRVREVALGAYAHADVPFEQVVEALQPERDLSRHPLVQVMLQVFGGASRSDGGARPLDGDRGVSTFDLALDVWEREDGLEGRLEYSTDLFQAATIDRMLRHLETILEAVAFDRDRPIASLPMLSPSELADLARCNDTARHYPAAAGVHRMVAAQCERAPDAPACVGEDGVVTYGELRRRVRAIHALLAAQGVRRGDIVAVSLPRGSTWVASLLAIFEAGAALLPLDAAWPEARQLELMHDAGAQRLLAAGRAGAPPAGVAVLEPSNASAPATPIESPATEPTDLAYVLYTSGSTGRPKGVAIEHHSLLNHAHAVIDRLDLGSADRVLQFAPVSFDVSLEEVLPTLAAGAAIVFRPGAHAPSSAALVAHMASAGVTVANLPAAFWHHWVDEIETAPPPPCLRLVIVGSEPVDAGRVATWHTRYPSRPRLVNAYGTTETTITSLMWEVDGNVSFGDVPIGRPLANVTCHLLDRHLQPVPAGVAADLYIGGAGVARGYVGPEPLELAASPAGAARLYRTGDRAKRREDGNIVFLGRSDDQLKVRGHRVEPAEIVAALKACAGVKDAVVRQIGDRVIAYVTGPDRIAESDVLSRLRGRLPVYMVPSAIVQLDAIPVGAHGKTRLLDLPVPSPRAVVKSDDRLTAAERLVSSIWEDALETSQPPLDANFFELGGHSLLLLRVHTRLERAVGRSIAVVELFRHPTIASLAGFLSADEPASPLRDSAAAGQGTVSPTQVAS